MVFLILALVALFLTLSLHVVVRSNGRNSSPFSATLGNTFAIAFRNEGDPTEQLPTVLISTANGPVRINASDFDPETMTKHVDGDDTPTPAPSEQAPTPVQRFVSPEGTGAKRRFFVVDGSGAKLTGEGIETGGYATEAEAWGAITAINASEQGA